MRGNNFIFEMRILKLGGCDVVHEVDFMRRFGHVLFDYQQLLMTLRYEDREITIKGLKHEASVSMIS